MKRQLTLAEYRSLDLTLFAVILAVCEYIITLAAIRWFPGQLYTVSLSAALCAIVLMRWGPWAGLHALLGGTAFWLASGGTPRQLAVYALGNPLGLGLSVSSGIVSAVERETDISSLPALVTTADISSGSSGGALLNEFGHVVAVTSGAYIEGNGMYLAIPADSLLRADFSKAETVALKDLETLLA